MKLFGIDKEKLEEQIEFSRKYQKEEVSSSIFAVLLSLVPIESEKKEEQCTKCNGEGDKDCTICDGAGENIMNGMWYMCPHCNGTGVEPMDNCKHSRLDHQCSDCKKYVSKDYCKEPRKEEPKESPYEVALVTSMLENACDNEAKLSRYKESMQDALRYLNDGSTDMTGIARRRLSTALAEEDVPTAEEIVALGDREHEYVDAYGVIHSASQEEKCCVACEVNGFDKNGEPYSACSHDSCKCHKREVHAGIAEVTDYKPQQLDFKCFQCGMGECMCREEEKKTIIEEFDKEFVGEWAKSKYTVSEEHARCIKSFFRTKINEILDRIGKHVEYTPGWNPTADKVREEIEKIKEDL